MMSGCRDDLGVLNEDLDEAKAVKKQNRNTSFNSFRTSYHKLSCE